MYEAAIDKAEEKLFMDLDVYPGRNLMASTPSGPVAKADRILILSVGSSLQTIGAINHGMSELSGYSQSYSCKADRSLQNNSSSSIWCVRFSKPGEMIPRC
jgi:hypothetical protein